MEPGSEQYAMHMLFTAKWNIPRATKELGLGSTEANWQHLKQAFRAYCQEHPTTWQDPC